ncbi:MAG: hypothetical protein P4N59_16975 [Negativicutes bacterium]|nr:hypothetical protein [Negativicutes bacterium]
MTHTLLRTGDIESQKEEFCWLVYQTKGVNDAGFVDKALDYIAIIEAVGGDNWGDTKTGSVYQVGSEVVKDGLKDNSRIRGVFSSRDKAVEFLEEVVAKELGLSVLIAGVLPEVAEICAEVGIVPHSANFSLGVWGRKDKLPTEKTLSITTMCGHHTLPTKFVESVQEEVAAGKVTPEEGAKKLAAFCYCGVFNPVRCADILSK